MKISLITVCKNAEATLESCIRSVIMQDYPDIEYVIVDGKSTDGTLAIVEKYKTCISKFVSEKDSGMYHAVNKGLALSSGEVVGILNADDFYPHEKIISGVMKEFQTKETCSVYGDLQYVSRANPRKIIRHWKSKPYHRDLFLKGWMPPHPAFFVKKKCYEQYGTFNTSFTISADYELMLRFLFKHGISSSYMPEVLVRMRMGGISNLSLKNRLRANREDRNAWKVNGVHPGSLTLILKPLSKLRQFLR